MGYKGRPVAIFMMFVFSSYFLLPFFWLIIASTKSDGGLFNSFGLWFAQALHFGSNLTEMASYNQGIFGRWFVNSLIYAVSISFGATLVSAMAGFALAKYEFAGREIIFMVILTSIMVPFTALVLPIFLLMKSIGLINTYWAVILPSLLNPFGIYLMRIFWNKALPNVLFDAARIDGASDLLIFTQIGLPLVSSGLATVALFSFVAAWNNFFLPLVVLNNSHLFPLTLGLSIWIGLTETGRGPAYSAIIVGILASVIPLIIGFVMLQRYWQADLSGGAVKQ